MAQLLTQRILASRRDTGGLYNYDQAEKLSIYWSTHDWGDKKI